MRVVPHQLPAAAGSPLPRAALRNGKMLFPFRNVRQTVTPHVVDVKTIIQDIAMLCLKVANLTLQTAERLITADPSAAEAALG